MDVGRRGALAYAGAVLGPPIAAGLVVPWRADVTPVNAALVLVLVIVAVAAAGYRLAGALASLGAAVSFDVLLTRPYGSLRIADRADAETAVLLLAVGLAVAELASWGRRLQAERSRTAGYLAGVRDSVDAVADDAPAGVVVDQVARQIGKLLQVRCTFDYGSGVIGGSAPRLRSDGEVEVHGVRHDVEQLGLPRDAPTELLVTSAGRYLGRFVLAPSAEARPALAQRLAALTLANRAAEALAARTRSSPA